MLYSLVFNFFSVRKEERSEYKLVRNIYAEKTAGCVNEELCKPFNLEQPAGKMQWRVHVGTEPSKLNLYY